MRLVIFNWIGVTLPFSSSGGVMSKTCNTVAMLMKRDASAKYLPGQILSTPE